MSSQGGSTSRGVQSESRARQTTKLRWEQVLQFLKLKSRSKARSRAEGPDVKQATRDTGAHQHQSNPTPATPETADVQTHASMGRYAAVDSASNHNPEPSQATSRLRTSAHNLLTESWTSICHMGIAEARELDQFLNRIENGYHRERLTSLTAIGFNDHVEQASCAFFDGGSDDNTIEVSVMNRLGIPWTRIENSHVSLRPRMGLCQYDGRPIPVLGFGAIQWSFRNFPGFLFTTPVKVVGDGYGQEILFGHGFRRDLRNAINEVKDADENGSRRYHRISPQMPVTQVRRLLCRKNHCINLSWPSTGTSFSPFPDSQPIETTSNKPVQPIIATLKYSRHHRYMNSSHQPCVTRLNEGVTEYLDRKKKYSDTFPRAGPLSRLSPILSTPPPLTMSILGGGAVSHSKTTV